MDWRAAGDWMSMRPLRSAVLTMSITAGAACVVSPALADGDLASAKPADAVQQAQTALQKVSNLAFAGSISDKDGTTARLSGVATSSGPLDIVLTQGRATTHIVALPKAVYIRANLAYWKQVVGRKDASLAPRFAGRWIKETAKEGADATAGLGDDLAPKHIATCLTSHVGTLTNKGEQSGAGGSKVVVISDAGDKPGTAPGQLWLDERTALPVREVQSGPSKAGGRKDAACDDSWPDTTTRSDVTLSRFGKAPKVVAPRHAVTPKQAAGSSGGSGGGTQSL
jgi:hypothetical protein